MRAGAVIQVEATKETATTIQVGAAEETAAAIQVEAIEEGIAAAIHACTRWRQQRR